MDVTRVAVIGVDAGGTKTAAALATPDGRVLGRALSGPANYQAVGAAFAQAALEEAIAPLARQAAEAGFAVATVGYGLSGLDRDNDAAALAPVLEAVTPEGAAPISVNDTFLILRAGTADGVGVGLVSGTGANCVGWGADGAEYRVGGLCAELGDYGGGGDVGLAALQAARRSTDGRGPATVLHRYILEFLGLDDITDVVDLLVADSDAGFCPSVLAPLVHRGAVEGDGESIRILREAGEELGLCARLVAERLFSAGGAFPVVMGGSLLQRGQSDVTRQAIADALAAKFPQATPRVLSAPPVLGAVLLALDRLAGLRGGPPVVSEAANPWKWPDADVVARLRIALEDNA